MLRRLPIGTFCRITSNRTNLIKTIPRLYCNDTNDCNNNIKKTITINFNYPNIASTKRFMADYLKDIGTNIFEKDDKENFKYTLNNILFSTKDEYEAYRAAGGFILMFFTTGFLMISNSVHHSIDIFEPVFFSMVGGVAFGFLSIFLPLFVGIGIVLVPLISPLVIWSYFTKETPKKK